MWTYTTLYPSSEFEQTGLVDSITGRTAVKRGGDAEVGQAISWVDQSSGEPLNAEDLKSVKISEDFQTNSIFGKVGPQLLQIAEQQGIDPQTLVDAANKAVQTNQNQAPLAGMNQASWMNQIIRASGNPKLQPYIQNAQQLAEGEQAGFQAERYAQQQSANNGMNSDLMDFGTRFVLPVALGAFGGSFLSGAGSGSTEALSSMGGSDLMNFMSADAASAAGQGAATAAGGTGGAGMDWVDEFFGNGGWSDVAGEQAGATFNSTMSPDYMVDPSGGGASGAADQTWQDLITREMGGGSVNGIPGSNSAGIQDFIKGAIESGNLGQLARVLPSIPGGSNMLKALMSGGGGGGRGVGGGAGGGSGGSWLDDLFGSLGMSGKGTDAIAGILGIGSGLDKLLNGQDPREAAKEYWKNADPYGTNRAGNVPRLNQALDTYQSADPNAMLGDPYARARGMLTGDRPITTDPSYQWRFDQGNEALRRTMAGTGQTQSGAEQLAAIKYGQGAASQEFGSSFGREMTMGGADAARENVLQSNVTNKNKDLVSTYGTLAGATQAPAQAGAGALQAQSQAQGVQNQGMADIMGGVGTMAGTQPAQALARLYNTVATNNIAH